MSIVLTDLSKRFGQNLIVNRVSLEINDGELFVLLGGSGSGKSTILRMIAGLLVPDSGIIELNGRDVTYLPPQARGTGFVFQNYSIFRHMTVADNVEFGLRIRGRPKAERRQRSEELLDLVGLAGLGSRFPDQLSGGQQQRVALARALAYQPEVLLLDEPFGALDVKIRAQLRESLKEIQRTLNVTTILVTHDQEEAFELADRIGVIERGYLIEVGSPETLYHRPQSEFVATFVGKGNVLVGRAEENHIQLGMVSLPFPKGAPAHDSGAPARILFRPEAVAVSVEKIEPLSNVRLLGQGRVIGQVFTGAIQRIRLEMGSLQGVRPVVSLQPYGVRTAIIEAQVQSQADVNESIMPGQELWVWLQDYHVLAPSGLKILICMDGSPTGAVAADLGLKLAQATNGPTTLLGVASTSSDLAGMREELESLHRSHPGGINPRLITHVRQGSSAEEILMEAQEGDYEVVAMGRGDNREELGSTARQVLEQAQLPVLLVQDTRERLGKILICTAGGQPGKSDVRFGGRLARRMAARVTVFHVRYSQATPGDIKRVWVHMMRAQRTLEALGVSTETKITSGNALEQILSEAETGDYDLIVIGAPAPHLRSQPIWNDLATQIVGGTTRPVVVVPMQE
ncbi:MAG: ATP-binding cassette domain-containing protein [Chloroflexota bacterium]